MLIEEKNVDLVVSALADKIRNLEIELWFKDSKIKELTEENERLKGESK